MFLLHLLADADKVTVKLSLAWLDLSQGEATWAWPLERAEVIDLTSVDLAHVTTTASDFPARMFEEVVKD